MRDDSSAIARWAIAIKQGWDELTRAEALLLRRPWEAEGELRWVREPGGVRLVGQELPARRAGVGRRWSGTRRWRRRRRKAAPARVLSR